MQLIAELLQRIDRHSEEFDRINERRNGRVENQQIDKRREQTRTLMAQMQNHQKDLDQHEEAFGDLQQLRERTEVIKQSSLEQQKAYQAMTELLMHHNRALVAKGIL